MKAFENRDKNETFIPSTLGILGVIFKEDILRHP